jgi:riboflavin kinase
VSDAPAQPSLHVSRRGRGEELRILKALALAGADRESIEIASGEVGRRVGASQQAADRHLVALEKRGEIMRTLQGRHPRVAITPQGMDALRAEYVGLRRIFEGPSRLRFQGTVVSGLGEGRYYLSQPGYSSQFPPQVGYAPFPGTLNVRVDRDTLRRVAVIRHWSGIRIEGFQDAGRTFGGATCYPARLKGSAAHLIRPDRTHYEEVVEFIAPISLRETLDLKDQTIVDVELEEP